MIIRNMPLLTWNWKNGGKFNMKWCTIHVVLVVFILSHYKTPTEAVLTETLYFCSEYVHIFLWNRIKQISAAKLWYSKIFIITWKILELGVLWHQYKDRKISHIHEVSWMHGENTALFFNNLNLYNLFSSHMCGTIEIRKMQYSEN